MKPMIDVYKFLAFLLILHFSNAAIAKPFARRGLQLRVAVAQFDANDRFKSEYGGWNIGGGLAAQLVTALIRSGRVIVVERAILSKVLMEQEISQNRLSSPFTQIPAGQLLGVDYLIVGEVTEFEERQISAGAAAGVLAWVGPKVSSDISAAHVGMDIRIVDTRTGEVLHSHRASGKAWGKAFGVKFQSGLVDFGGEVFHKTPLGKATRRSIEGAVDFILQVVEQQIEEFAWTGRVIDIDGPYIYIDAGRSAHISVGDQLKISDVNKVLTDPETNGILGLVEKEIGKAQVVDVELKYAKAKKVGNFEPTKGNLVRLANQNKIIFPKRMRQLGYRIME